MRFIVAVDGSEQADRALEHALDLAGAAGAAVTVVHAVNPTVYETSGSEPVADLPDAEQRLVIESIEDAERRGNDLLEDATEQAADQRVEIETELLYGDPPGTIAEYAANVDADGVFVGHRGLSERYERVLGSVAKTLVEVASVPVTVVR